MVRSGLIRQLDNQRESIARESVATVLKINFDQVLPYEAWSRSFDHRSGKWATSTGDASSSSRA
jgi:hypothetical protein